MAELLVASGSRKISQLTIVSGISGSTSMPVVMGGSTVQVSHTDFLSSTLLTQANTFSGNNTFGGQTTLQNGLVNGGLVVKGDLTANQYIISSSISHITTSFSSGSTKFGDSGDDTHQFTGSVSITGSFLVNGIGVDGSSINAFTQSVNIFSASVAAEVDSLQNVTASYALTSSLNAYTASNDGRVTTLTSVFNSYTASNDGRVNSLISVTGSYATTASLNAYTASNNSVINSLISVTGSYATTGSNTFRGNQTITGSLNTKDGGFSVSSGSGFLTSSARFIHNTISPSQGSSVFEVRHINNDFVENFAVKLFADDFIAKMQYEKDNVTYDILQTNLAGDLFLMRDTRLFGTNLIIDGTLEAKQNTRVTGSLVVSGSGVLIGNQTITGSLIVSGSSTFTNIGLAKFTGSVNVTGSVTADVFQLGTPTTYLENTAYWLYGNYNNAGAISFGFSESNTLDKIDNIYINETSSDINGAAIVNSSDWINGLVNGDVITIQGIDSSPSNLTQTIVLLVNSITDFSGTWGIGVSVINSPVLAAAVNGSLYSLVYPTAIGGGLYTITANESRLLVSSSNTHFSGDVNISGSVSTTSITGSLSFNNLTNRPALVSSSQQIKNYGDFATTGSNTFFDNQTIVGNVTFPSSSFISTTNASGGLSLSALDGGTLFLNADGGEGDVLVGRNNWSGSLKVRGNTNLTGSLGIREGNINLSGSIYLDTAIWNYVTQTYTSIPVTYGATELTFTVLPDNTITDMIVAVGAGGYTSGSINLTIPGTTFPGGTTPANDIVFNIQTFESAGPVYSTDPTSAISYVSGTPPQRYDNISSTGTFGIGADDKHWTFDTSGSFNTPGDINVSGSVIANSFTGSFTGSFVGDGSGLTGLPVAASINTGSFATTGSNTFIGNQIVTGSVTISGSISQVGVGVESIAISNTPITTLTSATGLTAIGFGAGESITTGYDNTFIGNQAGRDNETGYVNTFVGAYAGALNTSGIFNTFIGRAAGQFNTTGERNTFVGTLAGQVSTGNYNTFLGSGAGAANTSAGNNTFLGTEAGGVNTLGTQNTFVGRLAGQNNSVGNNNTILGASAGNNNASGSSNTFVGRLAGTYIADGITQLTGSNNSLFLGTETKANANSETNQIVIGHQAVGNGSNTVTIGNNSITDTYLKGDVSASLFTGSFAGDSLIIDNDVRIENGFSILTSVSQSLEFANDTAAAAGGVPLGGLYRSGNFILIRLV
jgi:hypothetical protein